MTITELIEKLQICKNNWGNLQVVSSNLGHYSPIDNLSRFDQSGFFKKLTYLPDEFLVINYTWE